VDAPPVDASRKGVVPPPAAASARGGGWYCHLLLCWGGGWRRSPMLCQGGQWRRRPLLRQEWRYRPRRRHGFQTVASASTFFHGVGQSRSSLRSVSPSLPHEQSRSSTESRSIIRLSLDSVAREISMAKERRGLCFTGRLARSVFRLERCKN
jgi:hypothetical protein